MTGRSHEDLASALAFVADEVYRCAACAERRVVALAQEDGIVADACLEAMLVHARSVLEFLLNKPRFETDIGRSDFPGPDWEMPASPLATDLRTDMKVINKHLAHLTWDRVDDSEAPWEEEGFALRIVGLAADWTAHLAKTDESLAEVMLPWIAFSKQALEVDHSEESNQP